MENYHSGRDLKSLVLNIASCALFLLPLTMFFYPQFMKLEVGAVVLFMILALLVPPMGWMRPHPYSDMPGNRPYPRKD
ncbi:hypothetical protein IV203_030182 [Nitzschia inconspicua]|uniref:Uncharacterized protein n=1 Tax=Nitzschia inconspicua TaxID=303405 RepID=A0A9K3Q1M8_9STRA|nr:hypothetical protein IV203_030182 [Nitzschia inconspicua]